MAYLTPYTEKGKTLHGELRGGLKIIQDLAESDRSNAGWQRDVGVSLAKVGVVAELSGELLEAQVQYTAGMGILEPLVVLDPTNAMWRRDLEQFRARLAGLPSGENVNV